MEMKQEAEDLFIEKLKIEIDEHFIPDEISYNTWNEQHDNQIHYLSIKQEKQEYNCDNLTFDDLQETCTKPESNTDKIVDASQKSQMKDFKQGGKFNIKEETEETNSLDGSIIRPIDDAGLNVDLKKEIGQGLKEESQETERDTFSLKLQPHIDEVRIHKKCKTEVNRSENRTEKKPFNCETCLKTFKKKDNYNLHMRIHAGEKPFRCEVCFKCFSRKDLLSRHILIHTGEKSFECEICCKGFSAKPNLYMHIRLHTGEKRFKCSICCKCFTQKQTLVTHLRSHTGEKPYKCDICNKSFKVKSYLNIHTRCHTGDNTFKCDICFKCFPVKSYLKRHLRCHTGENPLSKQF